MRLVFVYVPVQELGPTVAFYRDELGWSEAWREGEDTVAFHVPDSPSQVMVSIEHSGQRPGPMYLVDDLPAWLAAHADVPVFVPRYAIPGGSVAGLEDPAGNAFYVFDQPDAEG